MATTRRPEGYVPPADEPLNPNSIPDLVLNKITDDFAQCKPIVYVSERLGMKPGLVVLIVLLVCLVLIVTGIATKAIIIFLGFLYPGYMTFKAIESPEISDDIQWLTYWSVFTFFTIADELLDALFLTFLIPLYYPLKMIFIVWLFYPKTRGAEFLYKRFLRPILSAYVDTIDKAVADVSLGLHLKKQKSEGGVELSDVKKTNQNPESPTTKK
eukprot:TRINITY_DN32_c0_g2_i1.p2 TRINITY_DN32_c0_g2~~TRINITY_DN32_c0_g2_i1.p2  ORF type:complete len:213 (-),score=93.42 TRINITY_DN32_c0_g2_i1:432-1070(-)